MEDLKKDIPWLKRMENGTIGEARTKAFLLDRFWVLERSVDIEGADFLIQRKIFRDELYSDTPPVLGIIQVKYYESEATSQYIPVDYYLEEGKPRKDFFAILNTGKEDAWEMFFLTADEIFKDFSITTHNNKDCAYLPGKNVLIDKYKIQSRKQCLDRIETSLKYADFLANRKYLLSNHFIYEREHSKDGIEPIYKEFIPNPIDDIQKSFLKIKKEAQSTIYKLEDIIELYNNLKNSTDPEKAIEIIEDIDSETYIEEWCHNRRFSWQDDISDENFTNAVEFHKIVYNLLKADGNLDYSLKNKQKLYENLCPIFKSKHWEENEVLYLNIQLNSENLFEIENIDIKNIDEEAYIKIKERQVEKRVDLIMEWENPSYLNSYFHPFDLSFYYDKSFHNINEDGIYSSEDLHIYNHILLEILKNKYKDNLKDWL